MRGDHSSLDAWSYSKALTYLELEICPRTCVGVTPLRIATVVEMQHSHLILHSKYKFEYSRVGSYVFDRGRKSIARQSGGYFDDH